MSLREGGYLQVFDEFGSTASEHKTYTCDHCNKVVIVKHKMRPEDMGGHCRICDGLLCPTCVATGICEPFEEKLKQMEQKQFILKSYGI